MLGDELADSAIHSPTGASLLNDDSGPVQTHMSDLRFTRSGSMENATADGKSPANSASERHIEDRALPNASTHRCFRKRCDVRIVIDVNRAAHNPAEPIREREIRPSFDLMRAANPAGLPIHRA